MKRIPEHTADAGIDGVPGGGAAPGKRSRTESFGPVQRQSAAPVLATPPALPQHEDPFGLHLVDDNDHMGGATSAAPVSGPAAGGAVQRDQRGALAGAPAAKPNPNVRDPIVRNAADEAKKLPAKIAKLKKLAADFEVARGALDGDSVGAIGLALADAYADAEAALTRLDEGVDNADLLGAVGVDYSWDPGGDKSAARGEELTRLTATRDGLSGDLSDRATLLVSAVRPTSFRHQGVPGIGAQVQSDDMPAFIREQTAKNILLLDALEEITLMLEGAKGRPLREMAALRMEAADRLQFWVGDRDGFLFLSHALTKLGHQDLLGQQGRDGKELSKTVEAVTRGVPQTVDDIIATVREARRRDLTSDTPGAITLLALARERVDELAREDKIKKALPNGTHGLPLEQALWFAQEAQMGLDEQWGDLHKRSQSEGLWDYRLRQVETAAPVLRVISGELAFGDSILALVKPASKTSMIGAAAVGGVALGGAAAAPWLLASATAVAEVGAGAYAAAVTWIIRNPQTSTALAEFAGSIGLSIIDAGGIENFLESLKTPEGVLNVAMEVLLLKAAGGGGARGGADVDAPDAPRRTTPDLDEGSAFAAEVRDVLDRARAFKAATVEWHKQGGAGKQPAAATPDGDAVPVPGRAGGDDLPGFGTIYAEQLEARRAARAGRGGRRIWPTHQEWEAEYQAPPPGKDAAQVREKLMDAARERHPISKEMTNQEKTVVYWKQKAFFDGVEERAIARRNELREELAKAAPDERAHIQSEIERAELVIEAAMVKPAQGRLPINHEFAGRSVTLDHIEEKIADMTLDATERVRLQQARVVMLEVGITEVRFTRDGYPDFSPFVYQRGGVRAEVEITLRGTRGKDDTRANDQYRTKIGDEDWDQPDGFTWHHVETVGKMILVDSRIHDAIKHTGGVALYRMLTGDLDAY